nr:hemocytin-like [Vanessa tameamea]
MNLYTSVFILLFEIFICEAGYGAIPAEQYGQSDVQAPEYVPAYLKNQKFTKTNYPRKSYSGRKTMYTGTKTGYGGTKTGYGGTKTGFAEKRTWHSSGAGPTYKDFSNTANQGYTGLCEIECKNNGICVDRNVCVCPPNFHGKYCEFEKKACLVYPPLPMNSERKCSSEHCTITCNEGHKFIDGSTIANMRCVEGQWRPTRADLTSIPDCQPECNPPCLNGGVCLSVNTCQCPADYRGSQCQYSASVCDVRKLAFNGGYNCFGDSEKFSCKLNCPSGASFSTPAVELYTCLYSTGVFEPQPIPHCAFNEVIVITPSNHRVIPPLSQVHSPNSTDTTPYEITTQRAGKYGGYNNPVTIVVQDFTPKGGSCLTWAGVHYKTFDGKIYSFQSPCKHILVRDSTEHKYTIAIRHPQCERQGYCPSEIIIYLEEKMYSLSIAEDGSVVFRNSKRMIPMPAFLPGIRVSMPSDQVFVNLDIGVTLKWDTNDLVIIEGSVLLWNKTEGLCGTLDGNPENDMTTKEGNVAQTKSVMIASWELNKIGDICDSSPTDVSACNSKSNADMKNALRFCSNVFSKDKFRKCSKVMDVSQLLEVCQWDYCACTTSLSPEECACRTVSVYAKECLRHGVEEMRAWRDSDTCPMKCPEGKIYKSCGPDTQPSCSLPEVAPKDNATCVEGCFCPEGLLLESGRCVPKSECPCRVRNQGFPPGTVIPKGCNTCKCESGEWTCTQVPCGARCGAVGDPHYTTFDGLRYNFMGHCTYTLMKSQNITIDVENVACSGAITEAMNLAPYKGEGKPSCTKAVNLEYNGANIHLKQGGFILVNGKEINSLPVNVGDIRIRAASSLFIIIQLPIKVDLWWDGNTRVFVDVPPSFHEQTKGLCGTFNLNQKDDFLTPEGDVEQSALAFANKWKTREFCDDVITKEPEHPCKANIENKESAEKYCSKLKSKLFESCHWFVDVQPYYEDCLYDMCACAGDVSRCLCPILGDYASACARSGAIVHWRYSVAECELQCSGGQEYTVCADSCLRTCADVALSASATCKPSCVEGCACPVGQVLDNNNVCVPEALCPCFHKGMEFKPGYKEVRAGKRERDLCTCVGARWDCAPASEDQIQNYPPAEDLRSACSAANHMEFTTCETKEPLTCKNMHLPQTVTSQECRPGCQCKKGYVLEASTKKCVVPSDCPCHHGGQSYPDGHTMQEECNTCECKSGKWSCTERKCAGVCGAWGDSHVTTFDGQNYDFEGVCTYLLAKGTADGKDGFSVEIQNEPCGTTGATCSKSVTLRVGRGGADEEIVSLTKSAPLPDTTHLKRIKLRVAGAYVFLDVQSLAISLQWDRGLRVYVKVDSMWQNRIKGLCGNYNSDMRDDFQTPSGGGFAETSPLIFADSWKLKSTCPKPLEVTDHCKERPHRKEWASTVCGAMKRYPFSLCHAEVAADGFVSRCEADACACDAGDDCACACAALAAYAHACSARGVAFKWRTQDLCPMQCDGECSNYNECVSPCPPETCDNTLDYAQIKTVCEKDTCVEGMFLLKYLDSFIIKIHFNFTSPRNLTGIKTKGGPSGWVTAYNVMYTSNLSTFNPLLNEKGENKLVIANFDSDSVVLNEFRPPIRAQYLKVLPVKWQNNIEIKVEPIGCFEPYPPAEEAHEERVPTACALCAGVPAAACACAAPLHYDGENCVPRDQCPCLVGFITYPVGSTYRGDDCDECVCKLGGIADCKPAKQCICEPDLVPTLTSSCECLCEPCTNGTKICPTSKLCLPLDKWCDGLQDCPDDELACTTLAPVTETVITTVVPTVAATIPVTTTFAPTTTTEKPIECPKVECPPGYIVRQTSASHSSYKSALDLPPPRPRYSYQRFYKGSKGGRGYSKGGFSKTSFSKGGYYSPPSRPQRNQAFTLDKPALTNSPNEKKECVQFKCIPHLPPIPPKGSTPAPLICSTPACPPTYSLRLESVPEGANKCPQYICVPPPERPVFCNVTGRTFSTFDGSEYKYDICNHILARENRIGEWTILLRKKCDSTNCQNQLLVLQDMELILVKPNMMIEYNDYEYTVEQTNKICFQKNSFDVNRLGDGIAIKSRKYNFTVLYSPDGDVKIGVSKKYMGHVDGLCGLFNGDASDDRAMPNGRVATTLEQFGRAWAKPGLQPQDCRVDAVPRDKQKRVWDLCKVITEEPLSQCAKVLNLDKWRSICLEKICKCADLVINGTKKTEEECRYIHLGVGENWTSPFDPCESYKCSEVEEGKLEKVTTVQNCHTDCQPGWEYSPAPVDRKQCCGQCQPVACIVDGVTRDIGTSWTSPDFCANYTCANLNGTLQVQSKNESCPEISEAVKKQFVLSEEKIPEECCLKQEPIACRVGNKIYQEGQTWPSSDPCKNYTCSRDEAGLTHAASVETCVRDCKRGWKYIEPAAGVCCGHCVQDKCVVGDELKEPGTTWQSADNCTTFSCEGMEGEVYTTSAQYPCPDVSACAPQDLVNETCCQVCKEKPSSLSTCVPTPMPKSESVGLIRVHMGPHGLCVNEEPLDGFQECRGSCDSGTLYNNQTGIHDSSCECCQATRYAPLLVSLTCADGSRRPHRLASPADCACRRCAELASHWYPSKSGYSQAFNQPTPQYGRWRSKEPDEYTVPDMFVRYGTPAPRRQF